MTRSIKCRKGGCNGPAGEIDIRGSGKHGRSAVMGRLLRRKPALGGKHATHGIARGQLRRLCIPAGRGKRIDGGSRRNDQIAADEQADIGKDGDKQGSGDTAGQMVLIQLHLLRPGDVTPVSAQKRANLSFSFRRRVVRRHNCIRPMPVFIGFTLMMHLGEPVNHAKRDFTLAHDDGVGAIELQLIDLGVGMGAGDDEDRRIDAARLLGNAEDSPLVRGFGTADQFTGSMALVYRFAP